MEVISVKIEKPNLKNIRSRLIPYSVILVCMLTIYIFSRYVVQIPENSELLDVLILNQETDPIFYVTSQVDYTAIHDISNPKHITELNLTMQLLDVVSLDETRFVQTMEALCRQYDHITLSLLPSNTMTDKNYLNQYQTITQLLDHLTIDFIAYPATVHQLSKYHLETIDAIGVTIHQTEDFKKLQKVYTKFLKTKPIVVRDAIKATYKEMPQMAAKEITACYHLLATQYPAVQVVFSPYMKSNDYYTDASTLLSNDPDYYLFYSIYNRLFDKPWITTNYTGSLASLSPYHILNDYDKVEDTVELILNPKAKVLADLKAIGPDESMLYFRLNEDFLTINSSYPYLMTLDTKVLPNGLSRLTAILSDTTSDEAQLYHLDLNVQNPVMVQRAKRIPTVTTPNEQIVKPDTTYIPILMYHSIVKDIADESESSHVEATLFDKQMAALVQNGYTTINFLDLKNYVEGLVRLPEKPILITMDDGYINNYELAFPIYKKYNLQATLFVSAFYVPDENTERHFGWKAAREMEESGLIDIQSHGYNHTPFTTLSQRDILYQASLSKGIIESHLGKRDVSVLAYPQFRHNWRSIRLLEKLDFDFQITNLARVPVMASKPIFSPPELHRINVPNTLSADDLIEALRFYTGN